MDREPPQDPFADEPRKIGGKAPEGEEAEEANPAGPGRRAEEAAGRDVEPPPSQDIENPADGEAPSG